MVDLSLTEYCLLASIVACWDAELVSPPAEYKAKQRQAKKRKAEQASVGAVGAGGHQLAVFVARGGARQQFAELLQLEQSASCVRMNL